MSIMNAPDSGIAVRMYRQGGLGDCFLLAFRASDGTARYMLIDCGVFTGTSGGAARMKAIAEDISDATAGHLHYAVGTHEHFDHLSGFGFKHSKQVLDQLDIDQVWLAWTEDPTHALANRLREERTLALRALRDATARLKAADDESAAPIEQVLSFFGGPSAVELADLSMAGTAEQLAHFKTLAGAPRYRRPGEPPIELDDVPGVRIYVLGPPEDEGLLTRSDPSSSHSEVYEVHDEPEFAPALNERTFFYGAVLAGADAEEDVLSLGASAAPFDLKQGIPFDGAAPPAEDATFLHKHYGWTGEESDDSEWRRIPTDWLGRSEELALKLDNHVNNTSLVLAIELVETGAVLLFPGDAQVGNWLSWRDVTWEDAAGEGTTGSDLLRRTVLYKVGHHASHNATLREHGLELMESPDLVAMIPVHAEQAEKKKWKMPFGPLYERLLAKTRGRVLRVDDGVPAKPDSLTAAEWQDFLSRVDEDPSGSDLWVQYTVPG